MRVINSVDHRVNLGVSVIHPKIIRLADVAGAPKTHQGDIRLHTNAWCLGEIQLGYYLT